MRITFLGGAGTVTGSKFLFSAGDTRLLVDCGLFQGLKRLRERNWSAPPVDPSSLDAVVLTHAHIDHSGYLPALVRDGFDGPIHCTAPTRDLCDILLPDSGYLQEEDARYAQQKGFSKHREVRPLYTQADARAVAPRMKTLALNQTLEVGPLRVRLRAAGHILGAASVVVEHGERSALVSGDLGRPDDILMEPPDAPPAVDRVLMESTYGDRLHDDVSPVDALGAVAKRVLARDGVLLLPAFAVGRAQSLLVCLHRLMQRKEIPRVPIYVNSPMATDVTGLYEGHAAWHRLTSAEASAVFGMPTFVNSVEESKALVRRKGPLVIISASGMLTGGRVLHHLKEVAPDPRNGIVLPGYQAPGTRGDRLARGDRQIKVHGDYVPVHAEVVQLNVLSAHADQRDLLLWLGLIPRRPDKVHLVHGEPAAADILRCRIQDDLGFEAEVAEMGDEIEV